MGPKDFYTTFKVGRRDVTAAYTLRPEQCAGGNYSFHNTVSPQPFLAIWPGCLHGLCIWITGYSPKII